MMVVLTKFLLFSFSDAQFSVKAYEFSQPHRN